MNTTKLLDVVPQALPVQTPAPPAPRTSPQAVPALGDGATSDAIHQHAERQAEAAAAEAERKRAAAKPQPDRQSFNREVGLVDDTFEVFVDLVSPALKNQRFRIFGPPDSPPPPPVETNDPASAHAAYAGGMPQPPVVKKDA
jgi:hypothetical protein